MYLNYKSVKYPCSCRIGKTMQYSGLPEDFPAPVEGEVILCADDGFVMREDKVEDYLRRKKAKSDEKKHRNSHKKRR